MQASAALIPFGSASRITVGLTEETKAVLDLLGQQSGLSKTDLVNRAVSLYDYLASAENATKPNLFFEEPGVATREDLLLEPLDPLAEQVQTHTADGALPVTSVDAAGLPRLILIIALWLLAIGLPMAETQMSVTGQMVLTNEIADIALALAVTWRTIDKRRK